MKFCCASNAAVKNDKITRKKSFFFPKTFSIKLQFSQKVQIFRKNNIYFQILDAVPVILATYLLV